MCVMSPLPKIAPASAQATLLRFWLPAATWLLLLFIALGLLTSLLRVASFPTILAELSTSCFPELRPSNNSQTLHQAKTQGKELHASHCHPPGHSGDHWLLCLQERLACHVPRSGCRLSQTGQTVCAGRLPGCARRWH